jgi:DNA-binding CsgD family transcriptional regulator
VAKRISQEQKEQVIVFLNEGLTFSAISRIADISRMTVREISNGLQSPVSNSILTADQIEEVSRLFVLGYGETKIARVMSITRGRARTTIQKLGLSSKDHNALHGSLPQDYSNGKLCYGCDQIKIIEQFRNHTSPNRKDWRDALCLVCEKEYSKQLNATPAAKEQRKLYRQENKEELNQSIKDRKLEDPTFRLRCVVSQAIYAGLKRNGGSKRGVSIIQRLPYAIDELRLHIENMFEPWMKWENWGNYDPQTWDDTDPTTWKWQLDHIMPHSTFHYESMEDETFRECWALSNLRPYSAKLNALDGGLQTRHKAA